MEQDVANLLGNLSDQESDYLADTAAPFKTPSTRSLLSNLLVTPSLRKAYSSNLVGLLEPGWNARDG